MCSRSMEHYICLGTCGAESETSGVCEDPECTNSGLEKEFCDCEDGLHGGQLADQVGVSAGAGLSDGLDATDEN